jgi:hypothetical protein
MPSAYKKAKNAKRKNETLSSERPKVFIEMNNNTLSSERPKVNGNAKRDYIFLSRKANEGPLYFYVIHNSA